MVSALLVWSRPPLDLSLLLGMTAAVSMALYHMPYHLPALLAVAAALLVRDEGAAMVRGAAALLLAVGALTSFALVRSWENATGAGEVLWTLLLVSLSVAPAVTAVVALGTCVLAARQAPARHPRDTTVQPATRASS
jgi:hypothetical protein